ncbi:response regulator transcription factor [Piscinibacter sp.]|uniref:response regulator transcription factor n=1 Tax=Piscinibacter sp. TaxID=1903157 RepID=UPI00355A13B9
MARRAAARHRQGRRVGCGYFRRPPAAGLSVAACELRAEAHTGRLDAKACEAVLEAAGHAALARARAGGLTEREVEVLRSLARGRSMKEIARELAISPKTVHHHLQHIYAKIGVGTRAGATLYAMEQGYTAPLH